MPENIFRIENSTFINNRHSIVVRQYEESLDIFGNRRKRYNYTNLIVTNCTFISNDQIVWINTDPILLNFNQRLVLLFLKFLFKNI